MTRSCIVPRLHVVRDGLWVLALVLAVVTAGCLFPPVSQVDVDEEPRREGPSSPVDGVPVFEQRTMSVTTMDTIDAGLSTVLGGQGQESYVFDMPPRLDSVRLVLEWDDDVYDLDLAVRLLVDPGYSDQVGWEEENTEGEVGAPDSPAVLESTDRGSIFFEEPSQLRVTVSAKTAVDVEFTLTLRATHLVPVTEDA